LHKEIKFNPDKMHPLKILVLILFILVNCRIVPQSSSPEIRHLSMEQGLSQSNVNCILQDSKGFLWIGTKDGLNRYDGYNFRVYQNSPSDSNSLSDNYITALAEDSSGNIWAGTLGGKLNRINYITQKIKVYDLIVDPLFNENSSPRSESLPCYSGYNHITITSILCDKEGFIWAGTWGNGFFRYDAYTKNFSKHFFFLEDINSVSSNNILALAQDASGNMWIGTLGGGLNKLIIKKEKGTGKEEFNFIKNPDGIIVNSNISSLVSDINCLWIGSFAGLFKLNTDDGSFRNINIFSGPLKITCMSLGNSGNLWIGTFGNGILKYDSLIGKCSSYINNPSDLNSIDDNDIISLTVDRTGLVWAGTFSGYGVNLLNPHKIRFNYYPAEPNTANRLSDKIINSITGDAEGNLWIGTYKGGLNKFNRTAQSFEVFRNDPSQSNSISSSYITSVFVGWNNEIWAGTFDKGLNVLDKSTGKFIHFYHDPVDIHSISSNQVTSIAGDKYGNVWIGTFSSGLNKTFKENGNIKFRNYRKNDLYSGGIPDNGIKGLYNDSEQNLWVVVAGGYLLKYDSQNDVFVTYRMNVNPKTSEIISFCDAGDLVWIGTNGNGLLKFVKKSGQFIPENSYFLKGRAVYGILNDSENNLWLSTDNGIIKYNSIQHSIVGFNLNDGLQSLRFTNGAYYKANDGEMFFGGINGFNSFYPGKVKTGTYVPQTGITSFKVKNREVPLEGDVISLDYSENSITIEFSSFDFTDPLKNQYACRLVGYDHEWLNSTGGNRSAVYNNLPPGEYTFMLRSAGYAGNWNNTSVILKIIIDSPLYQKWWFILVLIFIAGGIFGYVAWTRINHYLSIQKLKEKLSADLHDNIGSGLTEISLLSSIARSFPADSVGEQDDKLKIISERASELVDNMSDIVWLVNPQNRSLKDLILRLKDAYSALCVSLGISFRLMNIEQLDDYNIIMEKRQNIYLIFKEGINNSIKYSGCRNIILSVESENKNFDILLSDDGSGFDMYNIIRGNGLNNMNKRANESGMQLELESSVGHGTVIRLKGKLK
jgi:ligand-binding sensor domain-containing protein/two-component sensor histidine kinase